MGRARGRRSTAFAFSRCGSGRGCWTGGGRTGGWRSSHSAYPPAGRRAWSPTTGQGAGEDAASGCAGARMAVRSRRKASGAAAEARRADFAARRTFLPQPELVEEDAPLRAVLVVADPPRRDDPLLRGHIPSGRADTPPPRRGCALGSVGKPAHDQEKRQAQMNARDRGAPVRVEVRASLTLS
jgi:hypothetical protein